MEAESRMLDGWVNRDGRMETSDGRSEVEAAYMRQIDGNCWTDGKGLMPGWIAPDGAGEQKG